MSSLEPFVRGGFLSLLRTGDVRALFARYSDIALAVLLAVIVGMMIVPLPAFVLDLFVTLNIAAAVSLLLIAIYVSEALRIATFPSLLLITTLFRLAIEVSATRLILLKANAGQVIYAFGNFVVAGNLVVGAVVFFILTMIQFIVISKGSERVAEVGARFTLDAMPGKQMSIDAELRGGHIDHAEARRRRALLTRESQFFGSMDGAMKFVKGDAIAGIVVLLTNIVGGLVIGMVQKGMDLATAARTYTLLTIGAGLVAQIPALVISTAAGIIVTRVSSEEEGAHLGKDIGRQILAQPRALAIAAALLGLLAIVPGLPTAPFAVLGGLLGLVAYRIIKLDRLASEAAKATSTARAVPELRVGSSEVPAPLLLPIAIDLSSALSQLLLPFEEANRMERDLLPAARESFFSETGIPLPSISLRPNAAGLAAGAYVLRLQEVPVARGEVVAGGGLALDTVDHLRAMGIAAQPAAHPEGRPAAWILAGELGTARIRGVPTLAPEEVIVLHLLQVLHRYGHEFVGIQETQSLLDQLERTQPALVREVVPKVVSPALLTEILRRLAAEGISLRSLREILGALAESVPAGSDSVALTEHVRAALRRQITFAHAGSSGVLHAYFLDPIIEDTVREAVQHSASGSTLALEPELSSDIVKAVGRAVADNSAPVIVTVADIRCHVRCLLEAEYPKVAVLSYQEIEPDVKLQSLGRITVSTG
jgi:type III secretion protein V